MNNHETREPGNQGSEAENNYLNRFNQVTLFPWFPDSLVP